MPPGSGALKQQPQHIGEIALLLGPVQLRPRAPDEARVVTVARLTNQPVASAASSHTESARWIDMVDRARHLALRRCIRPADEMQCRRLASGCRDLVEPPSRQGDLWAVDYGLDRP